MENNKPDCSKHKKDFHGMEDMKEFAEQIGNMHYEALTQFLYHLSKKIDADSLKDYNSGRTKLGTALQYTGMSIFESSLRMEKVWQISKPFMEDKTK